MKTYVAITTETGDKTFVIERPGERTKCVCSAPEHRRDAKYIAMLLNYGERLSGDRFEAEVDN